MIKRENTSYTILYNQEKIYCFMIVSMKALILELSKTTNCILKDILIPRKRKI